MISPDIERSAEIALAALMRRIDGMEHITSRDIVFDSAYGYVAFTDAPPPHLLQALAKELARQGFYLSLSYGQEEGGLYRTDIIVFEDMELEELTYGLASLDILLADATWAAELGEFGHLFGREIRITTLPVPVNPQAPHTYGKSLADVAEILEIVQERLASMDAVIGAQIPALEGERAENLLHQFAQFLDALETGEWGALAASGINPEALFHAGELFEAIGNLLTQKKDGLPTSNLTLAFDLQKAFERVQKVLTSQGISMFSDIQTNSRDWDSYLG